MGYVEQQDNHVGQHTVREALEFSAELRLPSNVTPEARARFVDQILEDLELAPLANRVVGDSSLEGLAPGELKRVTIGQLAIPGSGGAAGQRAAAPRLQLFFFFHSPFFARRFPVRCSLRCAQEWSSPPTRLSSSSVCEKHKTTHNKDKQPVACCTSSSDMCLCCACVCFLSVCRRADLWIGLSRRAHRAARHSQDRIARPLGRLHHSYVAQHIRARSAGPNRSGSTPWLRHEICS